MFDNLENKKGKSVNSNYAVNENVKIVKDKVSKVKLYFKVFIIILIILAIVFLVIGIVSNYRKTIKPYNDKIEQQKQILEENYNKLNKMYE